MLMLFWDWGEPLMHPRIVDMIRDARRHDIHTIISTNGLAGDSPERLRALVDAGLSYIIVCVDGATQETYSAYRRGGRLARVLTTLRNLVAARGSRPYPVIEFRSLATRYNELEFPQLLALAQDHGADIFGVKSLRPYDYRGVELDHDLVPDNDSLARYRYGGAGRRDPSSREHRGGPLRCQKPLFAPTLNADGTLAFCSYATAPVENFGSLPRDDFARWWQADVVLENQRQFLDSGGTDACRTCYFRGDHVPTMLYTVGLRELPPDIRLQRPVRSAEFLEHIRRAVRNASRSPAP
jgi:MoaA/NifB/PqqE/SkfB family radical SAM enzyme